MFQIPAGLVDRYTAFIAHRGVHAGQRLFYIKWLRYYLDFCHKYNFQNKSKQSLTFFIQKLAEKKQPENLKKQALHAVTFFYEMVHPISREGQREPSFGDVEPHAYSAPVNPRSLVHTGSISQQVSIAAEKATCGYGQHPHGREKNRQSGVDWTEVFSKLKNEIKVRHYSPRTLKTYTGWTRQFQGHLKSKDPDLVSVEDVKNFLTWLAVKKGVSASSQNQAFNALLFLFRHVLGKDFGKVDGVVRAKRKPYIPVVLSRGEVDQIIGELHYPYSLIVSLMYGCGLRISECLSLRVHNFNFDMKILTIHDGKGKKDRTVPIPEALIEDLHSQLDRVVDLHERDCQAGFDGVFLYGLLEKKYKNAARELVWQWFFPANELTFVPENKERRRYHVHETALQKALRKAIRKAKIPKRVTSHTFRHSFASHLLQANYDIRTIQQLLGRSDVRTTMIYTHTVQSVTIKEAKSPLDF
ncbi:MAG TPA: integron integrase [Desulfobacteraceae bacterium]|nr:integron integrase [Desulfobacteraceae bacterium]